MTGVLCLQGGAEFQPGCEQVDRAVLDQVRPTQVVVTALAGSPGRDYATATANGVRWWSGLGAAAIAAPDARADETAALDVLASADLVVLPGGSPGRLRAALLETGVGALLTERWRRGECALVGASAGAMVLCSHLVLPDRRGRPVVAGLGLLPSSLVVPHWSGRSDWLSTIHDQLPEGTRVLGLPECSGVIVADGAWTAWGPHPSELIGQRQLAVGETVVPA